VDVLDLTHAGLWAKWRHYAGKYGPVHAGCRFLGTTLPGFWRLVGRSVTARYRSRWTDKPGQKILNLGGGGNCSDQFLTADIDPRADVYVDMAQPLPFPSASVDGIILEEAIEHVAKMSGLTMLRECARICKPGGVIRISTPDLDWFARSYLASATTTDEINAIFYDHGHRHIYGRRELAGALSECGFRDVVFSTYRDRSARLGYLDSHADRFGHAPEISQYVEARRT